MIAVLQFDAASVSVLERLTAAGRLPVLADLQRRGRRIELETPATDFAAGAFHTLYSGIELGDHGLFYPFQWSAAEQRTRYANAFEAPPPVWERLARGGLRTLAIDPYESRPPADANGVFVCGWGFTDRVVLPRWSRPPAAGRAAARRFGRAPAATEVFGRPRPRELLRLRERLVAAPGRVATLAEDLLRRESFDLAWLTFSAAHLAGHQFWDLSQVDGDALGGEERGTLEGALDGVYVAVDRAIGRVLEALPAGADVIVASPVGMDVNTSRADLLPEMLAAVLAEGRGPAARRRRPAAGFADDRRRASRVPAAGGGAASVGDGTRADDSPGDGPGERDRGGEASRGAGAIWRLRAAIPPGVRGAIASAIPDRLALELTARLELRGIDWRTTRAFAHPADNQGYVRLNLRGREREGIVAAGEAEALAEEIAAGLTTFRDPDGAPAVSSVVRAADLHPGERTDRLPDLVVRWADRPATALTHLTSERFGTVARRGGGSGRSGNHTPGDAWAVVAPGDSRPAEPSRPPRLVDVAATICAATGTDPTGLPGEPLLRG